MIKKTCSRPWLIVYGMLFRSDLPIHQTNEHVNSHIFIGKLALYIQSRGESQLTRLLVETWLGIPTMKNLRGSIIRYHWMKITCRCFVNRLIPVRLKSHVACGQKQQHIVEWQCKSGLKSLPRNSFVRL